MAIPSRRFPLQLSCVGVCVFSSFCVCVFFFVPRGQGLPRVPNEVLSWPYHDATVYLVMAACIGSFLAACNTSPGVVRIVKNQGPPRSESGGGTGGASSPQREGSSAGDEGRGKKRQQQQQQQQQQRSGESERGVGRRGAGEGGGRHAGLYPHDGVVFVEGFCKTCRVVK